MDYLLRNTPPKSLVFKVLCCLRLMLASNLTGIVLHIRISTMKVNFCKYTKKSCNSARFPKLLTIICDFISKTLFLPHFAAHILQKLLYLFILVLTNNKKHPLLFI